MKCECCNIRRAKHRQLRDYYRYVCTACSLLPDDKFYRRINRRNDRGAKVEALVGQGSLFT